MRRVACTLTLGLVAGSLSAQVQVGALGYFVRQSTPTDASAQTGSWAGVEAQLALGRYTFVARGFGGSLEGTGLSRDIRVTALAVRRWFGSWLALGLDAEAARRESDQDVEVWRLYGAGATAVTALGSTGLRAMADVTVFPISNTVASREISTAVRAEVGLRYSAPRWPVEARMAYRLEDVAFSDGVDLRFGGVLLGAGVRFGRSRVR